MLVLFAARGHRAEPAIRCVLAVNDVRSGTKSARFAPNPFGYKSRHFAGVVGDARKKLPGRVLEVQLHPFRAA